MPRAVKLVVLFVLAALGLSFATGCGLVVPDPYSSVAHMKAALDDSLHPFNYIVKAGLAPNTVVTTDQKTTLVFARVIQNDDGLQVAGTVAIWAGLSTAKDDPNPQPNGTYRVRLVLANEGGGEDAVEFAGPVGWKPTAANLAPGGFDGLAAALAAIDKVALAKRGDEVTWGSNVMTVRERGLDDAISIF